MNMLETSPNGQKTLWEKEKLLITSNFSFSHSVFKRLVLQTRENQGLFGKGLMILKQRAFENIVGKGENAGNQHFLLIPQCFLPFSNQISISHPHLSCCLQMLSIWTSPRFCRLVRVKHTVQNSNTGTTVWSLGRTLKKLTCKTHNSQSTTKISDM